MPNLESPADYAGKTGNYVTLLNESSTNYDQVIGVTVVELLRQFQERFKPIWPEKTRELTQEKIASTVMEGDVIVSGVGDGTYSFLINTLLTYRGISTEVRRSPVVSAYGGNANMIAHELTPSDSDGPPSILEVINNGAMEDIFPLEASFTDRDKIERVISSLAVAFVGLGMTGFGALELEDARDNPRRDGRIGRDYVDHLAGFRGIKTGRKIPFSLISKVIDGGGNLTQSEYDHVYEASVINGSRMAKYGRFPARLTEREFFEMIIDNKAWHSVLSNAVRMRWGRMPGQLLIDGNPTLTLDYQVLDPTNQLWGQIDGEPYILPPHGTLETRRHKLPYRGVVYEKTRK